MLWWRRIVLDIPALTRCLSAPTGSLAAFPFSTTSEEEAAPFLLSVASSSSSSLSAERSVR